MTPAIWPVLGTIDAHGTLTMAEEHPYEIEVRVRAYGQEDAVLHREYVSRDSASTDKALKEVWDGVSQQTKARMRLVGDDR